jgi:hypothetical protein
MCTTPVINLKRHITFPANLLNLRSPNPKSDRLCGLVVRVPGYRPEMYCFL